MIGLSIATFTSSFALTSFLFTGIDSVKMMLMLYLYYVTGALGGYITYNYLNKNSTKIKSDTVKKINENPERKNNPKEELVDTIEYKKFLNQIKNLKNTSVILKGLVETRKTLENLKKENNSILEDVVEKMDSKSLDLTKNYLKTS